MQGILSTRQRRWVTAFSLLAFCSVITLALRPVGILASRPLGDDAFYFFTVARQLSLGHGISVDGIHATNGIQPLLAFLEAPLFWLCHNDRWLGVRLCFILFGIFNSASVWLLALNIARLKKNGPRIALPFWLDPVILGVLVWTMSIAVFLEMENGMETGLYSTLLLLSIYAYQSIKNRTGNSSITWITFGLLLGFLILARIDALFFVAILGVFEFVRDGKNGLKHMIIAGTVALIISLPWWIYNISYFGNLIPISGQAESIGVSRFGSNLLVACVKIADIIGIFFNLNFESLSVAAVSWIAATCILTPILFVKSGALVKIKAQTNYYYLTPFLCGALVLGAIYVIAFQVPYFLSRYFQPIRIIFAIFAGFAISTLITDAGKHLSYRRVLIVSLLAFGLLFSVKKYSDEFTQRDVNDLYRAALKVQSDSADSIGMFQSGLGGFMLDCVTNLDGKVNPDALEAIRNKSLGRYVGILKLKYLVDFKSLIIPLLSEMRVYGYSYSMIDSTGAVGIYRSGR